MGIFCEIMLFKPLDGAYQPGQPVEGVMRYAVDTPTNLNNITISLKGYGHTVLKRKRNKNQSTTYTSNQIYVDVDNVIQNTKMKLPIDTYEAKFKFHLPHNIPSSLKVRKSAGRYSAKCTIKYYIRAIFERSFSLFTFNKRFRKEITVTTPVTPIVLREPRLYEVTKKIIRPFSSHSNIVNIKATISNIVSIGGVIEGYCEVENNSSVLVGSTKIKLIEVYKFIARGGREVDIADVIPDSDSKTTAIGSGCTKGVSLEINIPSELHSIDNAAVVSRYYIVRIKAQLPMPHKNMVLNIAVQIGATNEGVEYLGDMPEVIIDKDPPPSYWEAMDDVKERGNAASVDSLNKIE